MAKSRKGAGGASNTVIELKSIAAPTTAALKRAGYEVPHSVVLHALAAAVNKRDWFKLLASERQVQATTLAPSPPMGVAPGAPKSLRKTLENVRSYLETPGDLEPEEVKYLLEDVEIELRALGNTEGPDEHDIEFSGLTPIAKSEQPQTRDPITDYVQTRTIVAAAKRARLQPEVTARFWTDDRAFELEIDPMPYLAQANDAQLAQLVEGDYGRCEAADAVAEYLLDRNMDPKLMQAFVHIDTIRTRGRKGDDIGFEVEINREQFLHWMDVHHKPLLAKLLCVAAGVMVRRLKEAEDPAGDWGWDELPEGEGGKTSEALFPTQQQACVDAYEKLNLRQLEASGDL